MSDKPFKPNYKVGEFKGHPVFTIFMEKYQDKEGKDKYNTLSFGKKKAEFIVMFFEEIKAFAQSGVPEAMPEETQEDDSNLPF